MKNIFIVLLLIICCAHESIADPLIWAEKASAITLSLDGSKATSTGNIGTYESARCGTPISGKAYWEIYIDYEPTLVLVGIGTTAQVFDTGLNYIGNSQYSYSYHSNNGKKYYNSVDISYGSAYTTGAVIGVAVDTAAGKIWFSLNGIWQASGDPENGTNPAFTDLSGTFYPMITLQNNDAVTIRDAENASYTIPSGFTYLGSPIIISGTLKEKSSDTSGATYDYFILDATNHTLFEYDTAAADGTYTVTVPNGTDEYCGVIIDNIGGAVYGGNFGTDTTDASGEWSITSAGWDEGETIWAFFVDPDKTYKTTAFSFTANASNTVADTHNEAGSPAVGTLVYAADFGTSTGYQPPNPIYDFVTGASE